MSAPPTPPTPPFAWRLFTPSEWAAVESTGAFSGTSLDTSDGFIHLSLLSEVRSTCAAYFAGAVLVVARVDLSGLRVRNDWVEKRRAFFPHVLDLHIPLEKFSQKATLVWDSATNAHVGLPADC